jgi:hypothetical protein
MRNALLMAALVVLVTLAGCLGGDRSDDSDPAATPFPEDQGPGFAYTALDANGLPVPVLLCHEGLDEDGRPIEGAPRDRCNFNMTPTPTRQGNEVTIAVNPNDPRNIVGGAKDYYPPDAGECVWDGVYVTKDGARSAYQDRSFEGSPWRLLAGDLDNFQPNYATQFWCTTDPVLYFDANGRLYYLIMAYQADPVTGSKLGEDELPPGALNDWAFNRAVQIVAISDDGGDSFHTFTPILEGTFPVNFHDKGWIAASPDGTIHVMWLAFFVPGNQYCRSTDEGQTYLCTEVMAPQFLGSGQGSFLEVGTGDEVYALWESSGIQMRRSMDTGETWDQQRTIQDRNSITMPGLESRDRRYGYPWLAADQNPDSPFADNLYVVWTDACQEATWSQGCRSGGSGVWLTSSTDRGETWSDPVRVSDHNGTEDWRVFPAVSVSPGGVIDVSWMDTHDTRFIPCNDEAPNCAQNYGEEYHSFTQYYTYSLDGGTTWSENFEVRDVADGGWDPALCKHQNGMVFIGDYNDLDSSWQAAHPIWPDTRDGTCNVFTATVQRPMFAEGWDPAARAVAEEWIVAHPI